MSLNLSEWANKSIDLVKGTNQIQDIHVDEFIKIEGLSKNEVVNSSIQLFNDILDCCRKKITNDISIYLSVELQECTNRLRGAPETFDELCAEYDSYSIPEVIIYKPIPLIFPPFIEIYRKPLLYKELYTWNHSCQFFYKENRTIDMIEDDSEYSREFNVIYIP